MSGSRQHVIPRSYLSQFANPNGQVWIYDSLGAAPRADVPENIGCENNFYSVLQPDGSWNNELDTWITGIEGKADPVFRDLLAGRLPSDPQAKYNFALYVALLKFRTRSMRRMAGEMLGKNMQVLQYATAIHPGAFEASMHRYEEKIGHPLSPEVKADIKSIMLDPTKIRVAVSKDATLMALRPIDTVAPIFAKMSWTLAHARHGFFVTSDNPVLRDVDPKTYHPIHGDMGYINPSMLIALPLSPSLALVMSHAANAAEEAEFDRGQVERINKAMSADCEQYLYSHVEHKAVAALAKRYGHVRPGMQHQGFGPPRFAEVKVQRRI
jgi:hypothetical protein